MLSQKAQVMSDYFEYRLKTKNSEVMLLEIDSGSLYLIINDDLARSIILTADEAERLSLALKEFSRKGKYGPSKPETNQPTNSAVGDGDKRYTYVASQPSCAGRSITIDGPSYIRREEAPEDSVESPSHYRAGKVECVDALDSATVGLTGGEGFHIANVIKYVWRWKFKNGLEDLKKARWYLDRLIKKVENERS